MARSNSAIRAEDVHLQHSECYDARGRMALEVHKVAYFSTTVKDQPGQAFNVLSQLAAAGVNLFAFVAIPLGPESAQFTFFPEQVETLQRAAPRAGLILDGPHSAILIQGDDHVGALADVHSKLRLAQINVYAATCVTDGRGTFGYILYLRPGDIAPALDALSV
jgi:hypothetical protein